MRRMNRQLGYTLVELMIGGVLGLFLFAGALQVFLSSSQTANLQTSMAELQERARFISQYLRDEFERAGWRRPTSAVNNATLPVPVTFSGTTQTAEDITACGTGNCDRIRITYDGIRDCLGDQVNSGATGLVTNTYFVQGGQLRCQGNKPGKNDIIMDNVESFQLLYGLDDSTARRLPYTNTSNERDGLIDRYVEAYDFNTNALATLYSIRFAILLRSSSDNVYDQNTNKSFTLMNEAPRNYNDRVMRLLVSGTAMVSNRE